MPARNINTNRRTSYVLPQLLAQILYSIRLDLQVIYFIILDTFFLCIQHATTRREQNNSNRISGHTAGPHRSRLKKSGVRVILYYSRATLSRRLQGKVIIKNTRKGAASSIVCAGERRWIKAQKLRREGGSHRFLVKDSSPPVHVCAASLILNGLIGNILADDPLSTISPIVVCTVLE
ncbi:uncharacterized protein BDV17DRAFT_217370 [Aspergillus undulatus]|uniref:uncharacterized protein n=1 Tax=Aspergillus undulatus TaxID=1810928 RepID=UPI003CCD1E9F